MHAADTPVQAAKYFWDDVRELLTAPHGRYRHSPQRAAKGIEEYKQDVESRSFPTEEESYHLPSGMQL